MDHLAHEPGLGELLADGGQHGGPEFGRHGVGGVQPPAVDPAPQPVHHDVPDVVTNQGRAVIERDQGVVAFEVVGRDHAVGVVQPGHPELGLGSGTFGQGLGHRREVSTGVVEDAVEQQPHATGPAGGDQGIEIGVVAEPGVDLEVVDRVVAMAARGEDRPEQQPVGAQRDQVIEPSQQLRQAMNLPASRHRLLLRADEAQRVHLPPHDAVDPGPHGCPPDSGRRLTGVPLRNHLTPGSSEVPDGLSAGHDFEQRCEGAWQWLEIGV